MTHVHVDYFKSPNPEGLMPLPILRTYELGISYLFYELCELGISSLVFCVVYGELQTILLNTNSGTTLRTPVVN